jgi:threonyl-tRNA synthetase
MEKDKMHNLRHSVAHLLAAAVMDLWPDTLRTIGPSIENGCYFDFEFSKPITEEDLPKIEKKMREILPSWTSFEGEEVSPEEAKERYAGNEYKHELIDEFAREGQKITFYKSGEYEDLCRGGHVKNPSKDINPEAFKLTHIAGAYWRGSENNKMLTRIYAAIFETKKELDRYLEMLEEAKKRDHRKLGKELDIFAFSDLVGAGLPLWTPKGTTMRHLLDNFVWELRKARGFHI